jgi:hypothetical protein
MPAQTHSLNFATSQAVILPSIMAKRRMREKTMG